MEMPMRQTHPRRVQPVRSLLFAGLVAVLPQQALSLTIAPEAARVANFGQVNGNYFRGAQPDQAGFLRLQSPRIPTVIDPPEDGKRDQPAWGASAGMQYFPNPLSSTHPAPPQQ